MSNEYKDENFLHKKNKSFLYKSESSINEFKNSNLTNIMSSIYDSLKSSTVWEYIDDIRLLKSDDNYNEFLIEFSRYFLINIIINNDCGSIYYTYKFSAKHIEDMSHEIIDKKGGFMTVPQLMVRIVLIISRFSRFYKLSPDKVKLIISNLINKNHTAGFIEND